MIKSALLLALLVGCSWDKHCNDGTKPPFPAIGGCLENAAAGSAGGSCFANTCNDALQCIGGICYECGNAADPPEPCCGTQSTTDHGSCNPGGGTCTLDTTGDGWYSCVGGAVAPPAPNCEPGQKAMYYVWTITSDCATDAPQGFCADGPLAAANYVAATFGQVTHGEIATDPNSTAPQIFYACATGSSCYIGSSDESKVTTFYAFTHDQVVQCEAVLGPAPECQWVDGKNDACPM